MKLFQKLICIVMSFLLLPMATFSASASSQNIQLNSIFEKDSVALGYIGSAVIFKDDVNSLVYDGEKYKYQDVSQGYPYTSENGTFMIPSDLFAKAFDIAVTAKGDTVTIGNSAIATIGSTIVLVSNDELLLDNPVELKGGVVYLPVRSVAQDILGLSYVLDRGMHIFDTTPFKYTNSPHTYETKEPIDSIYRFMQFEHKTASDIYSKMDSHLGGNVHPRIMTDSASLEMIKANALSNEVVSEALETTLAQADEHMKASVQDYELPDDKRLLVAARNVMERLVTLSTAYLMTGDKNYADRAWTEMENCFAWRDWNTSQHYLDNSELLYGVAVAFDSFYDCYSEGQKQTIMDKTWELSLKHTVDRYQGINFSGTEWRTSQSNWGFVCNGAVITAVLAFGREGNTQYQQYYDFLLECALQAIEYPIMLYFPDGAWDEGLAYWEYALRYFTGATLIPLYYSTGSTLDYLTPQGVTKIADMGLYMQSGNYGFNFSDNADEGKKSSEAVYALAMLLDDDSMMQTWHHEMESMNATHGARSLMWYRPSKNDDVSNASELPLDTYFRGNWVGSMKEEWYNPNGSCVFFKGGELRMNSHFDTGTFCFDTMGERWSVDLGKDSYNIEGGYTGWPGFELYVKRPEGHNCVVINPREDIDKTYYGGQCYGNNAEIIAMESKAKAAFSIVDLSNTYKYDTNGYIRGFYLGDDRRTLTIQDEISLLEPNSDIYWFMHTRANIEIDADGKGAVLSQNGKKVRVDMLTNASNASFVVNEVGEDVQRFPTDPVRPDQLQGAVFTSVKVLTLQAQGSGDVYITIKLTPMDGDYEIYDSISYTPVKNWTLPEGSIAEKLRADMIYANNVPIAGFEKDIFEYEIEVPASSYVPAITAVSSVGTVSVDNSQSPDGPTYVYVSDQSGRSVKYTINYKDTDDASTPYTLKIITAQFVPYEQQLRVLASIPKGYSDAKIYVDSSCIEMSVTHRADGNALFTSKNTFSPSSYGIAEVRLEATDGISVYSDVQTVRVVKAFSKSVSLFEDFNSLNPVTMKDNADTTTKDILASSSAVRLKDLPNSSYSGRYLDLTNIYTPDGSTAATFRFEKTATSALPDIAANPADDGTNGIIELSCDVMTSNSRIRLVFYPVSRAYGATLTTTSETGNTYISSFPAINYLNNCFGSSDKSVKANTWYNLRFLVNLNESTFEYYVDDELIDRGTFTYSDERIGNYIYGLDYFNISVGAESKAYASADNPVYVTVDNISITHTDTGAAPSKITYRKSSQDYLSDISRALIPCDCDSLTIDLNNNIQCATGDVTLQKEDGEIIDAQITVTDGTELSSKLNRKTLVVVPSNSLQPCESYKIVISPNATYNKTSYANAVQIPFKTTSASGLYAKHEIAANKTDVTASFEFDAISGSHSVVAVLAAYNDSELVAITFKEFTITDKKMVFLSLPASGVTVAKAFVWNNLSDAVPEI